MLLDISRPVVGSQTSPSAACSSSVSPTLEKGMVDGWSKLLSAVCGDSLFHRGSVSRGKTCPAVPV